MRRAVIGVLAAVSLVAPALGWNGHGHRTVTYLALDAFGPQAPDWLKDPRVRERIAYECNEPDRWRGWDSTTLGHINKPDHFLDVEQLAQFGLTLDSLPRLRNEYLRAMAVSKHLHPEMVAPYDPKKDHDRTKEWPGMALHAVSEQYAALQASFNSVRILEQLNDPARTVQLQQARENAIYHMGMLSHFVGDLAQPLHTTENYNGWTGENPKGYTTDTNFHALVDGKLVDIHGLNAETVRPLMKPIELNARDPWKDVIAYFRRSHAQVEPLYQLEKDGQLKQAPGRDLIADRLADGGATLGALYAAAWRSAEPTPKQLASFQLYNPVTGASAEEIPTSAPTSAPATP